VKRCIGAVWLATVIVAVSCAQGSDFNAANGGADAVGGSVTGPAGGSSGMGGASGSSTSGSTSSSTSTSTGSTSTSTGSTSTSTSTSTGSTSSSSSTSSSGGTGFGPCVTQAEIDGQGTGAQVIGFCTNGFAAFGCAIACPNNAVNPGDPVCGPLCTCTTLPPRCGTDAGTD
jgi:hypothetical protein